MDIKNHHKKEILPRLIAWEVTKKCPLSCKHCRASASNKSYSNEFTTEECFKLLDNIASFANPIMILTGGEPMAREDIYEIASYGTKIGLKMVMAPCGLLMDKKNTKQMKEAGIQRISLSIDGADEKSHDSFRQVNGAFNSVINAAKIAKEMDLEFQINTTVTKCNYKQLDKILKLAMDLGAVSYHPFLLVPTGRGKDLIDLEIDKNEYENVLEWIYEKNLDIPIVFKPTCAPHYYRIYRQKEKAAGRPVTVKTHGLNAMSKGCMGGQSFAFVSNTGIVQICGFLDLPAGDVRKQDYDFKEIWQTSNMFLKLRNTDNYKGKCHICEYKNVCGGCRARAHALTGDYLDEEPYCIYEPKIKQKPGNKT